MVPAFRDTALRIQVIMQLLHARPMQAGLWCLVLRVVMFHPEIHFLQAFVAAKSARDLGKERV